MSMTYRSMEPARGLLTGSLTMVVIEPCEAEVEDWQEVEPFASTIFD